MDIEMTDNGTPILSTSRIGKKYGRKWGLQDCTVTLPKGSVSALVGPNGAGKSTLLRLLAGLAKPTTGELSIFGSKALKMTSDRFAKIGYLDQERPLYKSLRVRDILKIGRNMNPRWDEGIAIRYLDSHKVSHTSRVDELSVGQQAQVALSVCLAKKPELLLLDEPCASLDPLARKQLMDTLKDSVERRGTTVVLSSHVISDFEDVCNHLIILSESRVQIAGGLPRVLAQHKILKATESEMANLSMDMTVISNQGTGGEDKWLVRMNGDAISPNLNITQASIQDIVLGYLRDQVPPVPQVVL